ncbi:hypothetical protein O9992_04420 [Vibrio lentus]|nr:hypothetical protein [Vibrio lentus]
MAARVVKETLEPTYGIICIKNRVMQSLESLRVIRLVEPICCVVRWVRKSLRWQNSGSTFKEGAEANGVDGELSAKIFDLVSLQGYGFNKSHSAAYALVSVSNAMAQNALPCGIHGGSNDRRYG